MGRHALGEHGDEALVGDLEAVLSLLELARRAEELQIGRGVLERERILEPDAQDRLRVGAAVVLDQKAAHLAERHVGGALDGVFPPGDVVGDRDARIADRGERRAHLARQIAAVLVDDEPASIAIEEGKPQIALEVAQSDAQRGLRDVQLL